MSAVLNKRLTEEEVLKLKEAVHKIVTPINEELEENEEDFFEDAISFLSIGEIHYLSCMTEISYHKIFSYLMYEYVRMNENNKKRGILNVN